MWNASHIKIEEKKKRSTLFHGAKKGIVLCLKNYFLDFLKVTTSSQLDEHARGSRRAASGHPGVALCRIFTCPNVKHVE